MELAQLIYRYERIDPLSADATDIKTQIVQSLEIDTMAPLYEELCNRFSWQIDATLLEKLRMENTKELASIEIKTQDAETNAGDTEVLESMFSKARYLSKIGNWSASMESFDKILAKPKTSTGKKIDAIMEIAKISLFTLDIAKIKSSISEAKKLIDVGGDWDRRNRLKVYEALYLLTIRDIKQASTLFLDCIATFTCVELCSYKTFMFYTILTSIVTLNRNDLRKKLVNDPHLISVIRDLPGAQKLLNGIYQCNYKDFFEAILTVYPDIASDRYLGPLSIYLIREYRVLAYSQFLEAYKSVMLSSMASSFGISSTLLDKELSRFIAAGRLSAKIDKVGDIIETRRPDKKNGQYQDVIKKGDLLLNSIQKLVRAIDV
eukprot:gene4622-6501_t